MATSPQRLFESERYVQTDALLVVLKKDLTLL